MPAVAFAVQRKAAPLPSLHDFALPRRCAPGPARPCNASALSCASLPMLIISMVFSASAFIRYALPLHLNTTLCLALPPRIACLHLVMPARSTFGLQPYSPLPLLFLSPPCARVYALPTRFHSQLFHCFILWNLTLPPPTATELCRIIAVRCHPQRSRRDAWNSGRY